MPAKTARRRGAATRSPEPEVAEGVMARALDHVFDNPAMSGGLVVMAVTATAIMSNAMFLQHGQHPEPLFATRPAAIVHKPVAMPPVPAAVPMPRSRAEAPAAVQPPPARVEPAPAAATPEKTSTVALVTAIQRELARLGIYTGAIDGIMGSRTRAAISTWQNAAGLKPAGEPTPELLAAMQKPTASIAPSAPAAPVVTVATDQVAAAVERAAQLEREQAALRLGDGLRRIQVALSQIGYGPLAIDGQLTAPTSDALRRFQLDNGLPVTGEPDDRVTERLVAIGAMKPT